MAYVPVPKDLTQVKTKLVFNLTKRQLIFFSLAAAVGVPLYFLLRKRIDSGIAAILMVTVMLPLGNIIFNRHTCILWNIRIIQCNIHFF